MNRKDMLNMIAEASIAPSVHNVQPARWRIESDSLILFEDLNTRLFVADPKGNDAAMSLGAAVEGLALAASKQGLRIVSDQQGLPAPTPILRPVAGYHFETNSNQDELSEIVLKRKSWRGSFINPNDADRSKAITLQSDDCAVVTDRKKLISLAKLADQASFGFMKESGFRNELLSWMRLSNTHERWAMDGLNALAMNLNAVEAWAAGIVMGPAFNLLDRFSLASTLLAEREKTASSAGLVIFHRPQSEKPFESGRHFYRLWLRIEAAGFGAAVLAALADDPKTAKIIGQMAGIPTDRHIVSAFRIGRRPENIEIPRARRPLEELLV